MRRLVDPAAVAFRSLLAAIAILSCAPGAGAAELATPEAFLGFRVGTDRKLAPWPRVLEYLELVDAASDRVAMDVLGKSTLGNDFPLLVITAEENVERLPRYREIARSLVNADEIDDAAARALAAEGKAIVLVTLTIHSTEVASTQMILEFAHEAATTRDAKKLAWLRDTILLVIPSLNPDGQAMIVDWYEKHVGTEFEAAPMPWLYHPYVGHDNNRDYYMLTQVESRLANRVAYHEWFPQIWLDEHQMGMTGPRMFVPPYSDPIDPSISPLAWRLVDVIGKNMSLRLELAGKTGVGDSMMFDGYWPGGTKNTGWFKNVVGILTEIASCRIASPVHVERNELSGGSKGLPEYGKRVNFPNPWPGGPWRLRDIVDYELIATWSLLETAATHREDFLLASYRMNKEAIERGGTESPAAFVIPNEQHDPIAAAKLVDVLLENGARVHRLAADASAGAAAWPKGTLVVDCAQPYGRFVRTMLEKQTYPETLPYAGGPVIPPYDSTSWSLPVSLGVDVVALDRPLRAPLERVTRPPYPDGAPPSSRGGYLLSRSHDNAHLGANRLLREGAALLVATRAGAGHEAGDFAIPPGALDPSRLEAIARETALSLRPVDGGFGEEFAPLRAPRVGLYKPWVASMDEGWTRFVLERNGFAPVSLANADMKSGAYRETVDVVVMADVSKDVIATGKPGGDAARSFRPMPPEYAGGIEKEGAEAMKAFVRGGGTLVAMGSSCDWAIEALSLPAQNVLDGVSAEKFSCPKAMLALDVDAAHPLAFGMRRREAGCFAAKVAFKTQLPYGEFDRRVVMSYPEREDEILVSGYLKGAELLAGKAAVVDFSVGKGRVVLVGFAPQNRAQPHRTFKLLFNALWPRVGNGGAKG